MKTSCVGEQTRRGTARCAPPPAEPATAVTLSTAGPATAQASRADLPDVEVIAFTSVLEDDTVVGR